MVQTCLQVMSFGHKAIPQLDRRGSNGVYCPYPKCQVTMPDSKNARTLVALVVFYLRRCLLISTQVLWVSSRSG